MSSRNHSARRGHRWQRIERIVAEAFECDLLPSLEDPALADLYVVSVEVKGLSCIRVLLGPGSLENLPDVQVVDEALQRAENRLRMALSAIVRLKRVPVLRIKYAPIPQSQHAHAAGGEDE